MLAWGHAGAKVRIIAGSARGRRLFCPEGGGKAGGRGRIRPTAERAREALFSIIGSLVQDGAVLDLFAGTGALGLEAVSRGAASAVLVDNSRAALRLCRRNSACCGFEQQVAVVPLDCRRGLGSLQRWAPATGFTLVFCDPPYDSAMNAGILRQLQRHRLCAQGATVICEDRSTVVLDEVPDGFVVIASKRYGDTGFTILRFGSAGGPGSRAGGFCNR